VPATIVSPRHAFGALCLASVALVGVGLTASAAQSKLFGATLRPAPAATYVIGTTSGPLFLVENNGTAPFDTFGVTGIAGVGPDAIGVLGYGGSTSYANLALTGYDIGPGSVASVGYATYPEPSTGPGLTQTTGVLGIAPDGDGVMGRTSVAHGSFNLDQGSGYAGVVGVDGSDSGGQLDAGVLGETHTGAYGVEGISYNAIGGVLGISQSGDGVDGISYTRYGVTAESAGTFAAINASSSSGSGDAIDAYAGGSYGISAQGKSIGAYGVSPEQGVRGIGNQVGVVGQAGVAGAVPLDLLNSSLSSVFYVDDHGNVFEHGTTSTFVATSGGAVGRMFTPKSTTQTMEDVGSGAIANGVAVVRLDPSFAQLIDRGGYQVFLTPKGDCNGLYVAQENASAFVVRELHGGRSTLAFDYRIVGRQYGHATDRVAIAPNAAAVGDPQVKPAPLPANRAALDARLATAMRTHSTAYANGTAPSAFAIPRAAAGLVQNFGR
jgi:hypothetical protein